MSLLACATIQEQQSQGQFYVRLHYEDGHHEDLKKLFFSTNDAHVWITDKGWTQLDTLRYSPPAMECFIEIGAGVATDSHGIVSYLHLNTVVNSPVTMAICHTVHPKLGTCYGFCFRLFGSLEIDPILDMLVCGLFKVHCIGHWVTVEAATEAGLKLYNTVIDQLGKELFEALLNLEH